MTGNILEQDLDHILDGADNRLDDTGFSARWKSRSRDANESAAFIRQSLDLCAHYTRAQVRAECLLIPSTDHFTVLDDLLRPESAMVQRIAAFARATNASAT